MKRLSILGSTGSIGRQTLDVIRSLPGQFEVVGLASGYNIDLFAEQLNEWRPAVASTEGSLDILKSLYGFPCTWGSIEDVAVYGDSQIVVAASSGSSGLRPIMAAIEHGKDIALANKEPVVMAGELLLERSRKRNVNILPIDSEPSGIWQCLRGEAKKISRIIITGSGGPFRRRAFQELSSVTPEEALNHPTWRMGRKITVDSATLMNKAFEVIEAHWLFDIPWENIEVVIHPQSIVHAMVEFSDKSIKAQLSPADMRIPIQGAITYPDRIDNKDIAGLDLLSLGSLDFEEVDMRKYPCFPIALEAARKGGSYPAVLSAADEVAVDLFLNGSIKFMDIPRLLEEVLSEHKSVTDLSIDTILEADGWARRTALERFG